MARLKKLYKEVIQKKLQKELSYKNIMSVPRLEKIVINMGIGKAIQDKKKLDYARSDLTAITGQKPVDTKARKYEASFKLRAGMTIGCKVTLRQNKMYEFLDRLITIALPRVRDFRGLNKKSFDGKGNFSMGLKEQFVFPEIEFEKVDLSRGIDITICTTALSDSEGSCLLKKFNLPFRN